ncbi:MAG: hypothetical protein JNM18_23170 [Planctomycetaceae bacterium]|nr:hypothetical protein [Planctomycetaceae bacterium]
MDALKPSRLAMLVATTAGVPYMFSQNADPSTANRTAAPVADVASVDPAGSGFSGTALFPGNDVPVEGVGIQHVSQALRFDVSLPWVLGTWPRVTTGLADPQLAGYRVPLVTGTRPADVAGALTYYFNKHQQVERILFHGSTGDPAELIAFLGQTYGFQRVTVSDPGLHLYQRKEAGAVKGELRIKALGIVRQENPLNRWDLSFVMDRPSR